jgi:hypothetical protein
MKLMMMHSLDGGVVLGCPLDDASEEKQHTPSSSRQFAIDFTYFVIIPVSLLIFGNWSQLNRRA